MNKKNIIINISIFAITICCLSDNKIVVAKDKKSAESDKNIEGLRQEIESLQGEVVKLRKLTFIQQFRVNFTEQIRKQKFKDHFVNDMKTLTGMSIKLFYSFGKINGYVVFKSKDHDYAIINNSTLKLVIFSNSRSSSKTFFIPISKDNFRELVLYRGDRVIALPIESVDYGERTIRQGSTIKVRAECFHLKTGTDIEVY